MFRKLKLLFIPHPANNHRAILLQPLSLALLIGVYLLNQSFLRAFAAVRPGVLGYSSEITIQKVFDQTNQQRANEGLPQLKFNSTLAKSAEAKANDMFQYNYWAHNSPQGKSPWDFFKSAGYQYVTAGENLARDFYDTDTLLSAWMKSPTHRANIVSPKYQEIGIAVVNGTLNGVKTTLVVQHFGTPLDGLVRDDPVQNFVASEQESAVQGVVSLPASNLISPHQISQIVGLVLFGIIIGVLFVDGYLALTRKTQRFTGSNTGHIGFLIIIFILLIFSQQGSIF